MRGDRLPGRRKATVGVPVATTGTKTPLGSHADAAASPATGGGAGPAGAEEAPGQPAQPGHRTPPRQGWLPALLTAVRHNPTFSVALALGAILRVIVLAGFPPAVLVQLDSYIYLQDTARSLPDPDNPNGYPFFLWLLKPFHSLTLVAGLQHLMGLAVAVLVYVVLRRYGTRGWVAALATVPVLFDPRELVVEHAIMADTLATLLMMSAFALLLAGPRRISGRRQAGAGLLLGAAAIVRPTTLVLIVVVAAYLLFTRQGWRRALAALVAGLLPVIGYAAWFYSAYGVFNLTNSSGLFLWARTTSFAKCAIVKPPPSLVPLCPDQNPGIDGKALPDPHSWHTLLYQETPQDYLWNRRDWPWQPQSAGYRPYYVAFTPAKNARAQKFALRAIAAQPGDYALVVAEGIVLTFQATDHDWRFPVWHLTSYIWQPHHYKMTALRIYTGGTAGLGGRYGDLAVRQVKPWSSLIGFYQRGIYLPGGVLAAVFAVGLVGLFLRRGRTSAAVLLWVSALCLLVLPIAENQYNYRYALPTVPLAFMAAALVVTGRRALPAATAPGSPEPPVAGSGPW